MSPALYEYLSNFAFISATGSEIHGCMKSWIEVVIVLIHAHVHVVEVIHKETYILFVVKPGIFQSKIFYSITPVYLHPSPSSYLSHVGVMTALTAMTRI
jgi:hypothetical protein